ncbi:hypothetical protein [Erwinia typographi]|uniref:hypothetical protein n=1 Tax=Erwinia typographi TaxID=371042 RepID=UPI000B007D30|nr:hypothetical protein [Erwinia typographi]
MLSRLFFTARPLYVETKIAQGDWGVAGRATRAMMLTKSVSFRGKDYSAPTAFIAANPHELRPPCFKQNPILSKKTAALINNINHFRS